MYGKKEGSWDPLSYSTRWVGGKGGPTFRARKAQAESLGAVRKEGRRSSQGMCYSWRRACEYGQVVRHLVSHTQEKLICQWRKVLSALSSTWDCSEVKWEKVKVYGQLECLCRAITYTSQINWHLEFIFTYTTSDFIGEHMDFEVCK